jgi:hypothetical protein
LISGGVNFTFGVEATFLFFLTFKIHKNMSKPNIFKISTKELSQDGFFTWLILWAKPEKVVKKLKEYQTFVG